MCRPFALLRNCVSFWRVNVWISPVISHWGSERISGGKASRKKGRAGRQRWFGALPTATSGGSWPFFLLCVRVRIRVCAWIQYACMFAAFEAEDNVTLMHRSLLSLFEGKYSAGNKWSKFTWIVTSLHYTVQYCPLITVWEDFFVLWRCVFFFTSFGARMHVTIQVSCMNAGLESSIFAIIWEEIHYSISSDFVLER